jgi:hypothetical protein
LCETEPIRKTAKNSQEKKRRRESVKEKHTRFYSQSSKMVTFPSAASVSDKGRTAWHMLLLLFFFFFSRSSRSVQRDKDPAPIDLHLLLSLGPNSNPVVTIVDGSEQLVLEEE